MNARSKVPLDQDPRTIELWHRLRDITAGEYDIRGPIGRGGMATVFLAIDRALDRQVALKVIRGDVLDTTSTIERFKREARTIGGLSHPNIVPIHQVRDADSLLFFVMKYVDGRSLDDIIRESGPLDSDLVISVLAQTGSALRYAHDRGVVHRDVKPGNIMIDRDGWVMVMDFGIAKAGNAAQLTAAGMLVGTPAYMSPEQFGDTTLTGAADQYSLGVVAYEMLAGKRPFGGATLVELMRSHLTEPPPPLGALRPDLPQPLADGVMRMIEKAPEQRWPQIDAVSTTLEPLTRSRQDAARATMITLATSGSAERARLSVPLLPPRPPSTEVVQPRAVARKRTQLIAVIAGTVALGAAAVAIVRPNNRANQGAQSTVDPSAHPTPAQPNAARDSTLGRGAAAPSARTDSSDRARGRVNAENPATRGAIRGEAQSPVKQGVQRGESARTPSVTHVQLTLSTTALTLGTPARWSTRAFSATTELPNIRPDVRTEPAGLADVTANGELIPRAIGQAFVIAQYGMARDSMRIVISAPAIVDTSSTANRSGPVAAPADQVIRAVAAPFIDALRRSDKNAIANFFRGGEAAARALNSWLGSVSGPTPWPPVDVQRVGAPSDSVFQFVLPIDWRANFGRCRRGTLKVEARVRGTTLQLESVVPPATSVTCPSK